MIIILSLNNNKIYKNIFHKINYINVDKEIVSVANEIQRNIEDFWKIKKSEKLKEIELGKFKEFYNRVQYVNKNFSFFNKNGWQSDRGKIYIVHGKPKEIRYEFNEQGEFEFWYYNSMKNFTFINKYGLFSIIPCCNISNPFSVSPDEPPP